MVTLFVNNDEDNVKKILLCHLYGLNFNVVLCTLSDLKCRLLQTCNVVIIDVDSVSDNWSNVKSVEDAKNGVA